MLNERMDSIDLRANQSQMETNRHKRMCNRSMRIHSDFKKMTTAQNDRDKEGNPAMSSISLQLRTLETTSRPIMSRNQDEDEKYRVMGASPRFRCRITRDTST